MEQITIVDEATCWELLYNYCGLHEIALIDKINVFKKRRIFFPMRLTFWHLGHNPGSIELKFWRQK